MTNGGAKHLFYDLIMTKSELKEQFKCAIKKISKDDRRNAKIHIHPDDLYSFLQEMRKEEFALKTKEELIGVGATYASIPFRADAQAQKGKIEIRVH